MTTRVFISLVLVLMTALPAQAERPRPLAWAMEAMRTGDWAMAAQLAARDGPVAADVIEWARLRNGQGSFDEVSAFLQRRPDWPGERYLRKRSERTVLSEPDSAVLAFFAETPPQTPGGAQRYAEALTRAGRAGEAKATVVGAWRNMSMGTTEQALFLATHEETLAPHHDARLDAMLWRGAFEAARRMFDLASQPAVAVAEARIALRAGEKGVDALIDAVPASHANAPGLQFDRFLWRARKGRREDALDLLLATSVSADRLGRPEEWANLRRAMARDEMRDGDPVRAYEIASRHFLTAGSSYADLEWLSGYIALRKLNEPKTALRHFENHDAVVNSPISKGRAGYWRGRAYEAMGDVAAADQAYTDAAQYQTSFYGLLAAERADLPFDSALARSDAGAAWRTSPVARHPLFEAGMLLQASGDLDLAERFWTHYAERLDAGEAALLARAAEDIGQPHLGVMIGKRVAQRGIELRVGYYALHPVARQDLPMAPEMTLAIARRESEFDPGVQSGVGARGLMQIMPATGIEVAKILGRSDDHTTERLTSDPDYNAQLGTAYLAMLARRFDGNVVMMAAGYNAGPSRPDNWMEEFGDPRRGDIDIVDWIEHIPFRETQNYVMRVTESLPIYRALLGKEALPIPFSAELSGSSLLAFAPKGE